MMTIISTNRTAARKRAFPLSAVFAAGALLVASGAAYGQSMHPVEGPRPRITEFRGYSFVTFALEDDIWRLASNGRATMVYVRRRGSGDFSGSGVEGSDEGTWSMRNGQLCVEWRMRRDISGCYSILPVTGIHVRLVGPVVFQGTMEGE